MARDYRYGHKKKSVVARRSQDGSVKLEKQQPPPMTHSAPLTQAAKKNTHAPEPLPASPPEASIDAPPEAPTEALTEAVLEAPTEHKPTSKPDKRKSKQRKRSPELDKISKKASDTNHSDSSKKEANATEEAHAHHNSDDHSAHHRVEEKDDDQDEVKKQFFWLKATGLVLLLVAVTGWLIYAPLLLAFALEMGWIDEETRIRWDSRESRQPQLALVEKVLPPTSSEVVVQKPTPDTQADPDVAFTFYEELPKAAIQLAAQPLPVRTKAPVYLQLSSFSAAKEAAEERNRLAQKGYLVQVSPHTSSQGRTSHVLRMGPYEDQRVINRLKVELQKLGVDAKEVSLASVIKSQEPKEKPER